MKRSNAAFFFAATHDPGVDPDFENFGGELTEAQWRDPLPESWGDRQDFQQRWRAHQRERIAARRERLEKLVARERKLMHHAQLRGRRIWLEKLSARLHWCLWGENP